MFLFSKYGLGENCKFELWETPKTLQRLFRNGFTENWQEVLDDLDKRRVTRGTPNRKGPKRPPAEVESITLALKEDLKIAKKSEKNGSNVRPKTRRKSVRRPKKIDQSDSVETDPLATISTRPSRKVTKPEVTKPEVSPRGRPKKRKSTSGVEEIPNKRSKSVSESTLKKDSKNKRSKSEKRGRAKSIKVSEPEVKTKTRNRKKADTSKKVEKNAIESSLIIQGRLF